MLCFPAIKDVERGPVLFVSHFFAGRTNKYFRDLLVEYTLGPQAYILWFHAIPTNFPLLSFIPTVLWAESKELCAHHCWP